MPSADEVASRLLAGVVCDRGTTDPVVIADAILDYVDDRLVLALVSAALDASQRIADLRSDLDDIDDSYADGLADEILDEVESFANDLLTPHGFYLTTTEGDPTCWVVVPDTTDSPEG